MDKRGPDQPADLAEVARMLGEVAAAADRGEVDSPRWLRDRIKAAAVTTSTLAAAPTQVTPPIPDR